MVEEHRVTSAPPSVFYIADFISPAEERTLLTDISRTPGPRWTQLANRRLQNWGGVPHPKGMIAETMPDWLQRYVDKVNNYQVFGGDITANHVLLNEYQPGQGIMPHLDGLMFYPTISTISLGSSTVINFYSEASHSHGESLKFEDRLVTSLFVEPRSLLVLKDDMYQKYLHGIEELQEDVLKVAMAVPELVEVSWTSVDFTVFQASWLPSSPRLAACGCTLAGRGVIKLYSLAGRGLAEVGSVSRGKAVRCATFNSSTVEERELVTGDFTGGLAVWDVDDLDRPVEEIMGAHSDLVHCLAGVPGRLVSGGREGVVKVWDRRDMRRSVLSLEGESSSRPEVWTVEVGEDSLCAGYSNGDIRIFDCRSGKVKWESHLARGVTSLELLSGGRLLGGNVGGSLVVWDLSSDSRKEMKLEKSTVWSAVTCPHDERVLVSSLGSGALRLLSLTECDLSSVTSLQASDRPLTTFSWSRDKPGLAVKRIMSVVLPGVRLSPNDSVHMPGPGTYTQHGYIYSSLVGEMVLTTNHDNTVLVQVSGLAGDSLVPAAQDVVTARITSVNPRFAKCQIVCVGDTVLSQHYRGQVRKEDVRLTEKDRVEMYNCFRPGDIVLARVISLGDPTAGYLLSTAENSLGVVIAKSEVGSVMVPVSWTEMQCTTSYTVEQRKVAKVIPEHLANS